MTIYNRVADSYIDKSKKLEDLFPRPKPPKLATTFTDYLNKKEVPLVSERGTAPQLPPKPPVGKTRPTTVEEQARQAAIKAGKTHYWSESEKAWKLVEVPKEVPLSRLPFQKQISAVGELPPFKQIGQASEIAHQFLAPGGGELPRTPLQAVKMVGEAAFMSLPGAALPIKALGIGGKVLKVAEITDIVTNPFAWKGGISALAGKAKNLPSAIWNNELTVTAKVEIVQRLGLPEQLGSKSFKDLPAETRKVISGELLKPITPKVPVTPEVTVPKVTQVQGVPEVGLQPAVVTPPAKIPPLPPTTQPGVSPVQPAPTAGILGDLQDTDELVTVMTQPDAYRKIANLPGVRNVMSYLNPAGVANTAAEKAVVARAALREEGVNKTTGAFANLEAIGRRDNVWGKLDDAQRLTMGKLAGKPLDEVLTYRTKYVADMTPRQIEWAQTFHELETAKFDLLERNGIRIDRLSFEEGGEYVGRRVAGRIDPQTGELAESAFIRAPGPGRPGALMGVEKTRYFKDINEALEQGFRYLPPDEALYLNLKGAYNKIADKQVTDWILDRVAYRTAAAPQALIDAASSAKNRLNKSQAMLAALNRALRGERGIPEQIVNSIAIEYPAKAKTLKALIADIRLGQPTGDAVKLFESEVKQLISKNKVEYWQAVDTRARAREVALQTHFGEARVSAPAFAGKILTGTEARETAETLNRAFTSTYGDIDKIIGGVNKLNSIGRYFMLAGDASPLMIQLIAFPFRFPKIFAESAVGFTKALFSPESQARYLARNNAIIQKSRNLILSKGGQTEFTEAFRSGGIMQSKLAKVPKVVLEPFQRGFEGAIDMAGIELRKSFDYMATTPERTAAIEQFINEIRGVTSSARLGVTPSIRAAETVALLAPRYMRAILALVSDIARGGIRGDQARKALIAFAGGMTALTTGITLARGEGWEGVKNHLDITKPTQFLTWDVAGQNVGPGSKFRSILILLGKMINDPIRMVDHASNFMRSNSSIAVSTGYDILTGRDYIGEPTRPGKGVSVGEGMLALTKTVIADNLVPIWLQSIALQGGDIEQRLTRGVVEFFGGRSYPASAGTIYAEKWREDFKDYNAIPTDDIEFAKAKKENPKLLSRERYRQKYPDIEAKLFVTGQISTIHGTTRTANALYLGSINKTIRLIADNNIDPRTISGIETNLIKRGKYLKAGIKDIGVKTATDKLIDKLISLNLISNLP